MDKIAYFSKDNQFSLEISKQIDTNSIEKHNNIQDLLNYLINVPDTPYMIFESKNTSEDSKFIEAIFTLNNMLPIFFLSSNNEEDIKKLQEKFSTIYPCNKNRSLDNFVKEIDRNPRKANRVHWPLTANFFKDPKRPTIGRGNITSLSIGGLFINTLNVSDLSLDDKVYLDIKFMDFSFLVEGIIVKLVSNKESDKSPGGFSVKFEKISDHTRKYILNLINHKLINMLVNDL